MRFERCDGDAHPVVQRESGEQAVQLGRGFRAVQAKRSALAGCEGRRPEPGEVARSGEIRRGGGLGGLAAGDLGLWCSVRNVDLELDKKSIVVSLWSGDKLLAAIDVVRATGQSGVQSGVGHARTG
jgi:hypothetical protein